MPGKHKLSEAYKRYLRQRRFWNRLRKKQKKKQNQQEERNELLIETQMPGVGDTDDSADEDFVPETQELPSDIDDDGALSSDTDQVPETNNIEDNDSDGFLSPSKRVRLGSKNTKQCESSTDYLSEPKPGPSKSSRVPGEGQPGSTGFRKASSQKGEVY